ncbi:MAG TPA: hypothetical protein VHA77_14805 [Xanthobacteraceae bacterium]|nr:hypothetical protein [Xanthobacteraceae bacterium]
MNEAVSDDLLIHGSCAPEFTAMRETFAVNMAAYGHTGMGGTFAWCDRDRRTSFAYCTNFQREGPGIGPRGAALAVAAGGGRPPSWLT